MVVLAEQQSAGCPLNAGAQDRYAGLDASIQQRELVALVVPQEASLGCRGSGWAGLVGVEGRSGGQGVIRVVISQG